MALLAYAAKAQLAISIFSGQGSLGYGSFWMFFKYLWPGVGSTGAAKRINGFDSSGLIPQASGGAFFIFGVLLLNILIYRMFVAKQLSGEN